MVLPLRGRLTLGRWVTNSGQSVGKIKAKVKAEKKGIDSACFNGRSNSASDQLNVKMRLEGINLVYPVVQVRNLLHRNREVQVGTCGNLFCM